jgi:hypothetical protein
LSGIISLRGKVNYTNSSRYSDLDEKIFRRWFEKKLNFVEFNRIDNKTAIPESAVKIAAWDCSFVTKSGKKTYGLAQFWNGKQRDRVGVTGLRPSPLPHHRTCGFPHPAVESNNLRCCEF